MFDDPTAHLVIQRRDELALIDSQLAAQETDIHQRRESIREELSRLEIAVEVFESFRRVGGSSASAPDIVTPNAVIEVKAETNGAPDLTGLKIADAAALVIAHRGGEARAADVLRELQAAERIAPGHGSYSTLHKTLSGDSRFERVDRGLWRLKAASL